MSVARSRPGPYLCVSCMFVRQRILRSTVRGQNSAVRVARSQVRSPRSTVCDPRTYASESESAFKSDCESTDAHSHTRTHARSHRSFSCITRASSHKSLPSGPFKLIDNTPQRVCNAYSKLSNVASADIVHTDSLGLIVHTSFIVGSC